jgi:hypothetical protein
MVSEMHFEGNSRIRMVSLSFPPVAVTDPPGAVLKLSAMQIRLYSNEVEAPLSPFIGRFLGNVCAGIASSLKTPRPIRSLQFEMEGETVRIQVNRMQVLLNMSQGFSRVIVLDTLRGMVRHLKMEDPSGKVRIEVDMEAGS